jgi:phosphoglycerate dehydrogenase-like enzyme
VRIVYPDADPQIKELLTKELLFKLNGIADFEIFEGRPSTQEEFLRRVQDADGMLLGWGFPADIMERCSSLKIISFLGAGVHNFIDVELASRRGITVTNTPDYGSNAVAEHAMGLLFALAKNITQNDRRMKQGSWDPTISSLELKGKIIGLIGVGSIGKRMADLCKAIGMHVIAWTQNPDAQRSKQLGIPFVGLEELLAKSDCISMHLPYTKQTEKFISEREFSMMKPGCIFINTARAELVDTFALVKYLSVGKLAGAGIDVFDEEPVSSCNPLLKLDNVILSPHVGFNTPEAITNILDISINNLIDFFAGTPKNVVTL